MEKRLYELILLNKSLYRYSRTMYNLHEPKNQILNRSNEIFELPGDRNLSSNPLTNNITKKKSHGID